MTDRPKLRTILRRDDVMRATGYRSTQLAELVKKGEFPRPMNLVEQGVIPRQVRRRYCQVDEWSRRVGMIWG